MNEQQRNRYARHILLKDMGEAGQEKITQSKALVIGAGGLGSPVCLYLSAAGVGHITVMDYDVVDESNLQRQIIHSTDRVGINKALSAKESMMRLNPQCSVTAIAEHIDEQKLYDIVSDVDVVLDCTDNFKTRKAVNRVCMKLGKPLVSGAVVAMDGQVSVYDPRDPKSPCYACLYPEDQNFKDIRAADVGVFSPLVGIIGTIQAAEALKVLAGVGETLVGKLLLLDARTMKFTEIEMERDENCPICATRSIK